MFSIEGECLQIEANIDLGFMVLIMRLVVRFFICSRLYCMGKSTSIFIWRFIKLKCAYGDLCILTISRIKNIYIFLFQFRSAISSDPYTRPLADPYFLKLTPAHVLPKVRKIVVNWQDPCFNHLSEKARAVKKKMSCLSEGDDLSVAIDKNVKNKWNWKWILEVDAAGVPFRNWC